MAEYRKISDEELKRILQEHRRWIESDKKEGKKASLLRANLQEANLRGARLQSADLIDANLHKTDLEGARRS